MSVNVIDTANILASQLRQTDEYRQYIALRQTAYEDPTNKTLLDEFKRLQFRLQAQTASGQQPAGDDMQKLMRISSLLQLNSDAQAYMLAELRFQRLIADIYKIIGDAAGIDIEALTQA
ncbi:MAG: YlbF family regulator [Clostridia bacterium]|nr:YlbF family regulator [Clostridia bacterium]MBR6499572.1 YlbF family regulator [Clostridia bacterium]